MNDAITEITARHHWYTHDGGPQPEEVRVLVDDVGVLLRLLEEKEPTMSDKLEELKGWIKGQCNRYLNGICTNHDCLERGGYKRNFSAWPVDYSIARCRPYDLLTLLDEQERANRHMETAIKEAEELLEDHGRPEGERLSKGIAALIEEIDRLTFIHRYGTPSDPTGAKTGTEIQSLRTERDAFVAHLDACRNIIRYVHFVLTGKNEPEPHSDLGNDVQIAADRLIAERDAIAQAALKPEEH